MRVDLPKGNWADLREADEVPERARRVLQDAQTRMALAVDFKEIETGNNGEETPTEESVEILGDQATLQTANGAKAKVDLNKIAGALDKVNDVKDAVIMCHVTAWSYDLPLKMESLLDLPGPAYDALHDACEKASKDNTLVVDLAEAGDPKSPTEPLAE